MESALTPHILGPTSLVTKLILLLLAIAVLGYDIMRARRKERSLPGVIAVVAVSVGLLGLLVYQLNLFGASSERAVSISGVLILSGVVLDLIMTTYKKLTADSDKSPD